MVEDVNTVQQRLLDRSLKIEKYKGEPFKCWQKGKELRLKIYREYVEAHEKGGLRVSGSTWSFMPVPKGLGDDVYWLVGEPFSASTANLVDFSIPAMEAAEARGWAPDICGYIKNYLGCIYKDRYPFGGTWPKPDFLYQMHICCSHAKWYQNVSMLEGGTPLWATDVGVGTHLIGSQWEELKEHRLQYVVGQLLDSIEWLEKTTGRKFDDEKFIEALNNDCNATSLWADICVLNQAVPAPMEEKSMFAWFNLAGIGRDRKEVTDFYKELYDEVKDRIARGIAALPSERCRILGDSPPPWGALDVYRYLEQYGAVPLGSTYSFAIMGVWEIDKDGNWHGRRTPQQLGISFKNREEAVRFMADWYQSKPFWQHLFGSEPKSKWMLDIFKQWKADGYIIHYNRGCEMSSLHAAENRLALVNAGIPVMTYEANHADVREFDPVRVQARIDAFMESLGLRKLPA